ncbi:Uncharacterized membrane protein YqjE [Thermomonospora echinospora]|uniref:Uncharacterized membrane protein YqjE n=1 Tax=Thermomonospora echinospora TaxID=1992 RepID=A0A1H5X753_9ACTN|nr:phage holin family protein [Thermomonospora echinospora]SEG07220.1 Uncharacterized membrane protein YqjE [Thermomonospora echinospora]
MAHKLLDDRTDTEPLKDKSVAELLRLLSDQVRELVQQELRMARSELMEKGKSAGRGAGMFGAAAITALFGAGTLLATIVLALDLVLPAWAAALIVAAVLLATAGIMALMGRAQTRKAVPPMPAHTVESVKRDVQAVKEHAHHH